MVLNNTPGPSGESPASILYNRNVRTTLPSFSSKSREKKSAKVNPGVKLGRDLPEIKPGTIVRMRHSDEKEWSKKGKVTNKRDEPRSYDVLNERGNMVRRNRRHLLPCNDKFTVKTETDDEIEVPKNHMQSQGDVPPQTNESPVVELHSDPAQGQSSLPESALSQSTENSDRQITARSGRTVKKPLRYRE